MPLYDFKCEKCGTVQELLFKPNNKKETVSCPSCPGKMKRVVGLPQIRFVGPGFYVNDHPKVKMLGKKDRRGRKF